MSESALDVPRLGNRGHLCETKRGPASLDTRAAPTASWRLSFRGDFVAVRDVGFEEEKTGAYARVDNAWK